MTSSKSLEWSTRSEIVDFAINFFFCNQDLTQSKYESCFEIQDLAESKSNFGIRVWSNRNLSPKKLYILLNPNLNLGFGRSLILVNVEQKFFNFTQKIYHMNFFLSLSKKF